MSPSPPDPQEDGPRPQPADGMTGLNRTVLAVLALSFLGMSAAVYLDEGVTGEALQLSEQASLGKKIWHAENCMVCHQFFGMGGYLGPDLTNVARRIGPETIAWVVRHGRGSMPAFELEDEEVAAVTAFLVEMDGTGTYPLVNQWPPGWFPDPAEDLSTP